MSDTQRQDLVEAILANPDEDGPLLVYADWLEEHGDAPRGELIRVQVQREQLPTADPAQVRLELRERALWPEHAERWLAELPEVDGARWVDFHRGLSLCAELDGFETLVACAEACPPDAPLHRAWVAELYEDEDFKDFVLPSLRELIVLDPVGGANLDWLAEMSLLSTLRELTLVNCALEPRGLRQLLASPHLGGLRALRLPDHLLGNDGLRELTSASGLALTELDLSVREESESYSLSESNDIDRAGIEALAAWPGLRSVQILDLSGHSLGMEELLLLLRSPNAVGLKVLLLRNIGEDYEMLGAFEGAHPDLRLQALALSGGKLDRFSGERLASAPCLQSLEMLELSAFRLRGDGFSRLARAPWFDNLRVLDASYSAGAPIAQALRERAPRSLHTLKLVGGFRNLSEESHLRELVSSPSSDTLLALDLAQSPLSNDTVAAFAEAGHLRELLSLRLGPHGISKAAADALVGSPLGARLLSLELWGTYTRLPRPEAVERYLPRRWRVRPDGADSADSADSADGADGADSAD